MISETQIIDLCENLKRRLLEENRAGTQIVFASEVHAPAAIWSDNLALLNQPVGETISFQIGQCPRIKFQS